MLILKYCEGIDRRLPLSMPQAKVQEARSKRSVGDAVLNLGKGKKAYVCCLHQAPWLPQSKQKAARLAHCSIPLSIGLCCQSQTEAAAAGAEAAARDIVQSCVSSQTQQALMRLHAC